MTDAETATRPAWMNVYDHLRLLAYNETVTYEQLSGIAGVSDIREHRGYVTRTRYELEATDRKTLVCIPNFGYRIADPTEHQQLGLAHRRKARRQLELEYSRRASTPLELLPAADAERQRLEAINAGRALRVFDRLAARPALPAGGTTT